MSDRGPTLAQVVQQPCPTSTLLRRARALGFGTVDRLLALAGARGCTHYSSIEPALPARDPRAALPDAELGILLLSGEHRFEPIAIRCAAQLLSGPGLDPARVARLARRERCERVLAHIARAGVAHDREGGVFWAAVLDALGLQRPMRPGVLPHWSRFVSDPGLVAPGRRGDSLWLRPRLRR